jgi:hypothetical protein
MPGPLLFGHGWSPDLPDVRDFTPASPEVKAEIGRLKRRRSARSPKPAAVDLREFCPAPSDAGPQHSAAVQAVLGMVACDERRATGRLLDLSPQFVSYTARRLDGRTGDDGVGLRTALKALVRFGCPPARFWPREEASPTLEPDAFAYGFQREFAPLMYLRLDGGDASGRDVLQRIKAFLASGWACVCGTSLPRQAFDDGDLAFPTHFDEPAGGTAFTIVGYDDAYRIRSSKGALHVRGAWGTRLGAKEFARLPYRYLEERVARDVWTVMKPEWAASGEFEQPV